MYKFADPWVVLSTHHLLSCLFAQDTYKNVKFLREGTKRDLALTSGLVTVVSCISIST